MNEVHLPLPPADNPTGSRNSLSVSGAQLRTEICVHGEAVTAVSLAIICQHTRLPRKVCVRGDDLYALGPEPVLGAGEVLRPPALRTGLGMWLSGMRGLTDRLQSLEAAG